MEFHELVELVRSRRKVETFEQRAVPSEKWRRILDCVLTDPTVAFNHRWSFLVLDDEESRGQFWTAEDPNGEWWRDGLLSIYSSPTVIMALANRSKSASRTPSQNGSDDDGALLAARTWEFASGTFRLLFSLASVEEGLGAFFIGLQRPETLRVQFGIPEEFYAIGAIIVGYPLPVVPPPAIRPNPDVINNDIHHGRWGVHPS